jgi:hypothetical protein
MLSQPCFFSYVITGFLAQYLSAKAVKLMPDGFLLGWCKLQELFTSFPNRGRRRFSPFASIPFGKGSFAQFFKENLKKYIKIFLKGTKASEESKLHER